MLCNQSSTQAAFTNICEPTGLKRPLTSSVVLWQPDKVATGYFLDISPSTVSGIQETQEKTAATNKQII